MAPSVTVVRRYSGPLLKSVAPWKRRALSAVSTLVSGPVSVTVFVPLPLAAEAGWEGIVSAPWIRGISERRACSIGIQPDRDAYVLH